MLDARQSLQGEPDRHAVGAGLALQKFDQGHTPIARPIRTRSQHAIALADALFHIIKCVKHGVFLQAQADFEVGGRVMNRWEEMSIDSFAEVLWKPGAAVGRLARASVAHLGDGVLRAKLLFHEADYLTIGADGAEGETLQADARECLLVLRELFQLPYRQTEWLAKSLVQLMRVTIDIPDYTSLAKRAGKLGVALDVRRHQGPVDVVVDSTGSKVFGEGEWKTRKHGISKRRTWRKLHLAVNPDTHEIIAETLTENCCDDAGQVDALLEQVSGTITGFYGDGACDKWKVYETLDHRKIQAVIPSQRNAKIKRLGNSSAPRLARDIAIREIRRRGRRQWKKRIGYYRRSLSETAMYRMKCCFGDHLKNRLIENQRTEARLRRKTPNKFAHLELPEFEWS